MIIFRHYIPSDTNSLSQLIHALYSEDPGGKQISKEKITRTLSILNPPSDKGEIFVFEDSSSGNLVGYAILIYYWSNEYGAFVTFFDELYISPSFRRNKIGVRFLKYIQDYKPEIPAFFVTTTPHNDIAQQFYHHNGYISSQYHHFYKERKEESKKIEKKPLKPPR